MKYLEIILSWKSKLDPMIGKWWERDITDSNPSVDIFNKTNKHLLIIFLLKLYKNT